MMQTAPMTRLPWRLEALDLNRVERARVVANEDLFLLLCAASFVESGSDLYTSNLVHYFHDDAEVADWLSRQWQPEELQHGRALKAYVRHVWPDFDWDTAFANFLGEYSKRCTVDEFERTRALELVARCVVETGTATLYRAISEGSDEPVLKEITTNIRTDEVRHYKYFFKFFKKYNRIEANGRLTVLGALVRRVLEIKHSDAQIALRHVVAARDPTRADDPVYCRQKVTRVNRLVRSHLSVDMCAKMLLKPLDLPARVPPGLQPLTRLARRAFFR